MSIKNKNNNNSDDDDNDDIDNNDNNANETYNDNGTCNTEMRSNRRRSRLS